MKNKIDKQMKFLDVLFSLADKPKKKEKTLNERVKELKNKCEKNIKNK